MEKRLSPHLLRRWTSLNLWERLAVAVWTAAVVVVSLLSLATPHRRNVYPVFATAARHWLTGEQLYQSVNELYRYSPVVATFFVPFSQLPDGPSSALWRLLSAGAFLGGVAWWGRVLVLTRTGRALLFLLSAPLAVGNLYNGQANLLVIGLLLVATAAVAAERFNLAALCLAVAVLFKLYPIALAGLLAVLYPRRLGFRVGLAVAAGLLLPFLLQRPGYVWSQYTIWLTHLDTNDRQLLPRHLWYRDLRQLCSVWVAPMSYRAYQALELTTGAGLAALALWLKRAGVPRPRLLSLLLGLACCWMTVLGPATESATYVLLAPVGAWLAVCAAGRDTPLAARVLVLGGYGLLLVGQGMAVTAWAKPLHELGPQPLGGLLLMTGLLVQGFCDGLGRKSHPCQELVCGAAPVPSGLPAR